jgi:mannan endo-1,4-beta-mannosidase
MALHLRGQDPNHLITVGSEGFFGPSTPELWRFNPADWANGTGQDFLRNLNSSNVDFGTVHAWPDNWFIKPSQTSVFLRNWINSHITAGKQLAGGKPIMFEEFGKKLTEDQQGYANMILNLRDPIYQSVYDYTQTAINNGDGIAGSLFWKLSIPVFQGQNWRGE